MFDAIFAEWVSFGLLGRGRSLRTLLLMGLRCWGGFGRRYLRGGLCFGVRSGIPLPPCFAQSIRNMALKSGLHLGIGEKVLFSKNNSRKVFERQYLARSGLARTGGNYMLDLVLPPSSIIRGVSRESRATGLQKSASAAPRRGRWRPGDRRPGGGIAPEWCGGRGAGLWSGAGLSRSVFRWRQCRPRRMRAFRSRDLRRLVAWQNMLPLSGLGAFECGGADKAFRGLSRY